MRSLCSHISPQGQRQSIDQTVSSPGRRWKFKGRLVPAPPSGLPQHNHENLSRGAPHPHPAPRSPEALVLGGEPPKYTDGATVPVTESAERGAECWPCPTSTFKDTAIVRFRSDKGPNFPREEFLESKCPFRFSSAALCPPPRCPTESWGCRRWGWRRLARHGPPADCRLSVHLAPPSSTPSPRACPPGPACSPHFCHPKDVRGAVNRW